MYEFDFARPGSVAEAVEMIRGGAGQVLAGGQTLIPTLKARLAMPERLVSVSGLAALRGLRAADGALEIGAATTHAEIAGAGFAGIAALAGGIGDPAVRSRGTIGGSIANNDPSACWPAAALACGATIITDRREIPAEDFFTEIFETALEEDELITALRFPIPEASAYAKFAQPASRFALAGVFVARFVDGPRVAVTGASDGGVFRWTEAEAALAASFAPEALAGLKLAPEGMMEDIHAGRAYRAHLVRVMAERAVAQC